MLPKEREREFLSTHLVFYRVGLNSLRFRLRCFGSLSPLCQRPLTSSTRFLLLLLLAPPPASRRLSLLVPPRHCYSFFPDREIATMALISRFSPRASRDSWSAAVVTWSLGYLVTRLPRWRGKRTPGSVRGFLRN